MLAKAIDQFSGYLATNWRNESRFLDASFCVPFLPPSSKSTNVFLRVLHSAQNSLSQKFVKSLCSYNIKALVCNGSTCLMILSVVGPILGLMHMITAIYTGALSYFSYKDCNKSLEKSAPVLVNRISSIVSQDSSNLKGRLFWNFLFFDPLSRRLKVFDLNLI